MLKQLKKKTEGFTIIEVMIVLAIAGLIILIVLLAIPTLQRTGRNTGIKNDATAITAAVNEFKSNNDGLVPNDINGTAPDINLTRTTGNPAPSQAKVQPGTTVELNASPPTYTPATVTTIYVRSGAKCNTSSYVSVAASLDVTAGASRSVAVIYPVEQRTGNPVGRCIDS